MSVSGKRGLGGTGATPCINDTRLLLDSRGVDVPMASNPTCVLLSSLKPLFFYITGCKFQVPQNLRRLINVYAINFMP
jgi:hypothetical protein